MTPVSREARSNLTLLLVIDLNAGVEFTGQASLLDIFFNASNGNGCGGMIPQSRSELADFMHCRKTQGNRRGRCDANI